MDGLIGRVDWIGLLDKLILWVNYNGELNGINGRRMKRLVGFADCISSDLSCSIYLFIHLSSIHPSFNSSILSFIHLSTHPSNNRSIIHASMHPCIHASMHPCIHASMHPCIHASMHPCIHASMHLSFQGGHYRF